MDATVTTTATLHARFGHRPADLSAIHALYPPPSWVTGYISQGDAEFLAEMVAAVQPTTVLELGVASGVSSAVLLRALDQLPADRPRTLVSCDVRPTCYFDDSRATGAACIEMYPAPRAAWMRHFTTTAERAAAEHAVGSIDLAFIDANHTHPWPLMDMLHVAPLVRPEGWIVLHDIELPVQHPEYQIYGPRWLFEMWPFDKVQGIGPWTSIGAVQLPARLAEITPVAARLFDRPWEGQHPRVQLPSRFAGAQAAFDRAECKSR